jgi:hypothetical protein
MDPTNTTDLTDLFNQLNNSVKEIRITDNNTVTGGGYSDPYPYYDSAISQPANVTISSPSVYNLGTGNGPFTITGAGTGGYSYPNVTIGAGTGITSPWSPTGLSGKIRLDGKDADIEVNGESLIGMIRKIEERLNILHPNDELEAEWEELRELGKRYRELEQHIKDKQATWDRLKAMPPPVVE